MTGAWRPRTEQEMRLPAREGDRETVRTKGPHNARTKRPTRILIFNGGYVGAHVDREVPFVQELRGRGYTVDYVLGSGNTTESVRRHPPHIQSVGRLWQISSTYCTSMLHLEFLVARSDLVLMGMFKGSRTISAVAKRYGKLVGQFDHSLDSRDDSHIDFFAVIGPSLKDEWLKLRPHRSPNDAFVVGSLQHDRMRWPEVQTVSREQFCKPYGIDSDKKIALFLTTSPEAANEHYQEQYRRICETIRSDSRFALMIKPHPQDYMKRRVHLFGGKHTWEELAPDVPVVRAADTYQSYLHCELGITLPSAVVYEFGLFRRPLAYIDDKKWIESGPEPWRTYAAQRAAPWVGLTTSVGELGDVLATGCYRVTDEKLYDQYIAKYCCSDDGLAYRRLADVVETVVADRLKTTPRLRSMGLYLETVTARLARRVRERLGGTSNPPAPDAVIEG